MEHADGASVMTPIARAASTRCRDTTLAPDSTVLVTIDLLKKKMDWIYIFLDYFYLTKNDKNLRFLN